MAYTEIPSDSDVMAALKKLNGRATAARLCDELVAAGHPRRDSQLAIQRAVERTDLIVDPDWTLRLADEAVAA